MKEIIIATETGSDLSESLIQRYGIKVVPMHIVMDGVDHADGSIPVDEVYAFHDQTKRIPTTSATNVAEYIDFYNKIREDHPDSIIYHLAYTSKASCTYQNADIALKDYDDVYLIDTETVSGGCSAMIVAACKLINEKLASGEEIDYAALAEELQALSSRTCCCFIPGNLAYLKAGGRVSNAAYLGATILQLKPLIEIIDGKLVASKKYRGKIENFVDSFMDDFLAKHDLDRDCLYLMYSKGLSQKALDRMAENATKQGFKSYEYIMTGCVISTHSGPGAIGLAGIEKA